MDFTICKNCKEEYKDARILPCGHSFCSHCISQTMLTSKNCSQCHGNFSSSPFSSLPQNYAIQTWLQEFPNYFPTFVQKEEPTSFAVEETICVNCNEQEGMIFCENCKIFLCFDCSNIIHAMRAFQTHSLTEKINYNANSSKFEKCGYHKKKKEFYCENCDELLCYICLLDNHNSHTTMSIYKFVENMKIQMKNSIEQTIANLPNLNNIEEGYHSKIASIDSQIIDLESKIQLLKEKKEKTQLKIINNHQDKELFNAINLFLGKFVDDISLCNFRSRSYYQNLSNFFQDNIDKIYVSVLPKYSQHIEQNNDRIELSTGFNNLENLSRLSVSAHGSRGIKPSRFYDPYFITLNFEENLLAVSDYYNRRIQMFNLNGDFLYQFGSKGTNDGQFNGPMGISICSKLKQIFICDHANHRIQMFDLHGNFLRTFGEKGTENGQFQFPSGIAISRRANLLAVADFGNQRVQIFDLKGNYKFQISRQNLVNITNNNNNNNNNDINEDEELTPVDVDISNKGNLIVVSDFRNHQIKVFDLKGNFRYQFGNKGDKDGEFNCPSGVAISRKANLLVVSDEFNHRISFFNLTSGAFKYHYSLGKNPMDYCNITNTNASENSKNVKVENIDNRNSEYRKLPDEFRFPRGIDLNAKANLIALADRGNNRFILIKSEDYSSPILPS